MKTNRKTAAVAGMALFGLVLGILRIPQGNTAPSALLYILLAGGVAAALVFGLLFGKKPAPEAFDRSDLFKTAVVLAGILTLGGALLLPALSGTGILPLCAAGLMALSGFGMILGLKETDSELPHIMVSLPIFASGIYLLQFYKAHVATGSNSDIYAFEVLTIILLTAALYSVASMRFMDRSSSLFVTASILSAVFLTAATVISTLVGGFLFSIADLLLCSGLALYCGAWYLNPPLKYVVPEADDEEDADDTPDTVIVPESDEE